MHSVGVGKSSNRNAREAGREAAGLALSSIPQGQADLVLVFATAAFDQAELLQGVLSLTGRTPLSGCSATGVITRAGSDEGTHVVAVLAIASDRMSFATSSAGGLSADPMRCGVELAGQVRRDGHEPKLLLVFPDGLTGNITQLLRALEEALPHRVPAAGGTAGELFRMERTWQYHDGRAVSDAVALVSVAGDFVPEIRVSHGSEPIGMEQVVTKASQGWIQEIDGQSAWSVYSQYLEHQDFDAFTMSHTCYICLAERLPEPDPAYGEYMIRCPLQLDRATGALFFPGNIETGARVRMALRSVSRIVESARESAASIVAAHPGETPALVLHFDCCCRASLLFGRHTTHEAIEPVQATFGPDTPFFGCHTYGEIGPLQVEGGRVHFHNYSTVLCAIYARPDG